MAVPIEIDVWQGDVAELEVDAIIVPANESLFMTSPVARSVKRLAGDAVELEAVRQGPVEAGSAVVTAGGNLAAPYLIHTVAVGHELRVDRDRLVAALNAAFEIAARLSLVRIAMAPVGLEHGAFSADDAAGALAEVLADRTRQEQPVPASLVVAVSSPQEAAAFRTASEAVRAAAT
jgi:O-acetyl-ADP-ribose deacetylase (regulator of RNase III)